MTRKPLLTFSVFAALAIIVSLLTLYGIARAAPATGNPGAIAILAVDPSGGSLFKAVGHRLHRSRDGGKSWQPVPLPPGFGVDNPLKSVAIPVGGNGKIYLTGIGKGVFRTTDGGASWELLTKGLPDRGNLTLAAHATLPGTLYAVAARKSIYRSQDSGTSWRLMDDGPGTISHLIHTNMKGSMQTGWLFAGTSEGVQRGMDCFCLWRPAGDLKGAIRSIAYDPGTPKHVFAISDGALFQSKDGGEAWGRLVSPARNMTALAIAPSGILYVAAGDGELFRREKNAATWVSASPDRGIYRKNCASCHGENGEGAPGWKTPNKQGELPAPPHDPTGHSWRHSDRVLFKMIAKGWRDPFNKTKRLTMPAFQDALSASEIQSVIGYLKSFWTDEQRKFQQRETRN